MQEVAVGILTGITASLVASTLFLLAASRLRPKILIAPAVAQEADQNGATSYRFKVVNKGRQEAINIRAELHLVERRGVPGGPLRRARRLTLIRSDLFSLGDFDAKDENAEYAYRFRTTDDIDRLWERPTQYLRLRLIATHPVSSLSRVFHQEFHDKQSSIKPGVFKFGESLEIEPTRNSD